jgi:GntR family transcriptional regulator / MocR family aminotransferase
MAVQWSTSAPELLLTLDRDASTPLRSQLEEQLRDRIRSGGLSGGERLPSTRSLAAYLELSRGVVQECYEQLTAEGYLVARPGAATRVADIGARAATSPTAPATRVPQPRLVADFQSGVPDLGMVPRNDWAWAMREACRTAPGTDFDYGTAQGNERLRQVLAAYIRRVRAADAMAERIMVCGGYQQGLTVLLRALAADGRDIVAVEDPGSVGTVTAAARAAHGSCIPVPVDEHGIHVGALEASGARVAVVTPAHQWPTGVVMAPHRRHELIEWARARDAIVVEDEYDAEFRYDRDPVGSLQGLAPDLVVLIGTVSKSLAPALRLGWALLPEHLTQPVLAVKQVTDRGAPTLDQLALAALLESGRYDRHLRQMRGTYANRRNTLVAALMEHAPDLRLTGLAAGFHAVAHLPDGIGEKEVVERARKFSVGLYGMHRYRSTHATTPAQLVMGFGNTNTRAIVDGVAAVAHLLR